jgi:hypothetical protein
MGDKFTTEPETVEEMMDDDSDGLDEFDLENIGIY